VENVLYARDIYCCLAYVAGFCQHRIALLVIPKDADLVCFGQVFATGDCMYLSMKENLFIVSDLLGDLGLIGVGLDIGVLPNT